jgi:hypothetical protein
MTEREAIVAPRRRVEIKISIGADSWEEARYAIRAIETDLIMNGGKLSPWAVSGGVDSGYSYVASEDEAITHESWRAANEAYCQSLSSDDHMQEKQP